MNVQCSLVIQWIILQLIVSSKCDRIVASSNSQFSYNKHDTWEKDGDVQITHEYTKWNSLVQADDTENTKRTMEFLNGWTFVDDDLTTSKIFPIDKETRNFIRKNIHGVLFSMVNTTAFKKQVKLAAFSHTVITNILQLEARLVKSNEFRHIFSGNIILRNRQPLAHRYGGHQFGVWADQLGDGRTHMLGEVIDKLGFRWEVQLKGSGKTPYSRDGDGRAVLRSSIREFLASEAMHYLSIPSSRAGSIIVSDDEVRRDILYNGNFKYERTAVVMRLARSWLRFGTIELLSKNNEIELLKDIIDTIITKYFNDINVQDNDKYLTFFSQVFHNTVFMVAKWMSVGFAHGVMNTDNFSIHGITIDYGPFRFLDEYNPKMVPNYSDDEHRYSFERQPLVTEQNLKYLATSFRPLLNEKQAYNINMIVNSFPFVYEEKFMNEMRKKLGIPDVFQEKTDIILIQLLFKIMKDVGVDFTMTFRELSEWSYHDMKISAIPNKKFWNLPKLQYHEDFDSFLKLYTTKVKEQLDRHKWSEEERLNYMKEINPRYVLRNWMAQTVIDAAEKDDFGPLNQMLEILQNPFIEHNEAEKLGFSSPPPSWADTIVVSCSS